MSAPTAAEKEADELKNQLQRLERLIHAIQTAPEPLRRKIAAAARNFAPKKQPDVIDIETADIVGALTRLCFSTATYQHDVPLPDGQGEIVAGAKAMLAAAEPPGSTPAVPRPTVTAKTVPELIALLPPWNETEPLLNMFARQWWGCNDLLFAPMWYSKVAGMYRSGFSPLPHPQFLAEIFGVLALSLRGKTSQQGPQPQHWHPEADRLAALCQRALDVGAYLDRPSLEGIRSLSLLVSYHAFWGTALARGLTILPVAMSLVMQLDFHRPDSDFEGAETPVESFERRALVSNLVRSDWCYPHTLGRASIADPKVFLATPPQMLNDDKFPPELVNTPLRASGPMVSCLIARHHLARLHQRMTTELYQTSKMKIASAAIKRYARDVETIEGTHLIDELRYVEDGSRRIWKVRDVDERVAISRIHANAEFALFRVRLHKSFIGGRAAMAMAPADFDEDYHREQVAKWARAFIWLWQEAQQYMGGWFVSIFAFVFDPLIALATLVILHPTLPEREACKQALAWIPARAQQQDSPPGVRRLGRLIEYLLARADSGITGLDQSGPLRKRAKTSHTKNPAQSQVQQQQQPLQQQPQMQANDMRRASVPSLVPSMSMGMPTSTPAMPPITYGSYGPLYGTTQLPQANMQANMWATPQMPVSAPLDWSSFTSPTGSFVDPLAGMTNGAALDAVNSQANDLLGGLGVDLGSNNDPLAFLRNMDSTWSADSPVAMGNGNAAPNGMSQQTESDLMFDESLLRALAGGV